MIKFNKSYSTGIELEYIKDVIESGHLSGDGSYTAKCHDWLQHKTGGSRALLTHSCTAALEMSAILADIGPGDEVIMPSYTFVSTANAFVLRGAVPVFVDIRADTKNIDENLIEGAITDRTKAIVPVHYAGVGCEMDAINKIAQQHDLFVIEDAAQGVNASYKQSPLGAIGTLGCYSFHETKNIISGEGGAIIINDPHLAERAEIIREKGTNRSQFLRGHVDKYTWIDIGSSYLPNELTAAFLYAQLEEVDSITEQRVLLWNNYYQLFEELADSGAVQCPVVPEECEHNAHMFYLTLESSTARDRIMDALQSAGIQTAFHYIPLHSSEAGIRYGRQASSMEVTDNVSDTLLRLPLWVGLDASVQNLIADVVTRSV